MKLEEVQRNNTGVYTIHFEVKVDTSTLDETDTTYTLWFYKEERAYSDMAWHPIQTKHNALGTAKGDTVEILKDWVAQIERLISKLE